MADSAIHLIISANNTANAQLQSLDKELKGLEKQARRNKAAFEAFRTAGLAMAGMAAAVGGASIKMAMDAEESENLFNVAMGGMQDAARKWSEQLSDSLGLNSYEIRQNMATIYQMTSSMGLGEQAAYDLSSGVTKLAYDMASFYNLDPSEAFDKLRSGLTGEAEPLKRLGILVDEATIKSVAYQTGIAAVGSELTQQQKVLARYQAILQQTANAQGDLARTLDSPTNQLRAMKAQVQETAIELGSALMPTFQNLLNAVKPVIAGMGNFIATNKELSSSLLLLVGGAGSLFLFIGMIPKFISMVRGGVAAIKLLTNVTHLQTAAQWLWNAAMAANPIGLAIAAVAMLTIGIGGLIYNTNQANKAQEEHNRLVELATNYNNAMRDSQGQVTDEVIRAAQAYVSAREEVGNMTAAEQEQVNGLKSMIAHRKEEIAELEAYKVVGYSSALAVKNEQEAINEALRIEIDLRNKLKANMPAYINILNMVNEGVVSMEAAAKVLPGYKPPSTPTKGYATGGPIDEPTLLYGLRSQSVYAMAGEAGPERVVPGTGSNENRPLHVTIEMNGEVLYRYITNRLNDRIRLAGG